MAARGREPRGPPRARPRGGGRRAAGRAAPGPGASPVALGAPPFPPSLSPPRNAPEDAPTHTPSAVLGMVGLDRRGMPRTAVTRGGWGGGGGRGGARAGGCGTAAPPEPPPPPARAACGRPWRLGGRGRGAGGGGARRGVTHGVPRAGRRADLGLQRDLGLERVVVLPELLDDLPLLPDEALRVLGVRPPRPLHHPVPPLQLLQLRLHLPVPLRAPRHGAPPPSPRRPPGFFLEAPGTLRVADARGGPNLF